MTRGDIVCIAISGDFGKPRPALIGESDSFAETGTVTMLMITSTLVVACLLRISVSPTPLNGPSLILQIMLDKAMSVR